MKKIIFLTGVIGSGKDYNADRYKEKGYTKFSFADGVRDVSWKLLNWKPESEIEYSSFKENMQLLLLTREEILSEISGRNFLITIGDGLRDLIDDKIWIRLLARKIKDSSNDKFVISDCRYPNEVLYFFRDEYEAVVQFCNYKSSRYILLDSKSELMAQDLLRLGYEDGDIVPTEQMISLQHKYTNTN